MLELVQVHVNNLMIQFPETSIKFLHGIHLSVCKSTLWGERSLWVWKVKDWKIGTCCFPG